MRTVDTLLDAQGVAGALAIVASSGGKWSVYERGDTLPADLYGPPASGAPAEVTMRQARLALLAAGKLAAVEAAINGLPDPPRTAARISWEYSGTVQRHNGFVAQIGPALGMTDAELDALFVAAARIA